MHSLAIDQGGTKTVAIVADDEGHILGKGVGAGACHFFDGMPKAMTTVEAAARLALTQAGLAPRELHTVSAGLAGANWPEEIVALETGLRNMLAVDDVRVYNDCLIALRGGTARTRCAVLCAGTGLNAGLFAFLAAGAGGFDRSAIELRIEFRAPIRIFNLCRQISPASTQLAWRALSDSQRINASFRAA